MMSGFSGLERFDPKSVTLSHWPKLRAFLKKRKSPLYLLSSVPGRNVDTGRLVLVGESMGWVQLVSFTLLQKKCDEMESVKFAPDYKEGLAFFLLPSTVNLVEHHEPGRPAKYDARTAREILRRRQQGETYRAIAKDMGMSTSTIQRLLATVQTPTERSSVADHNRRKRQEEKHSEN